MKASKALVLSAFAALSVLSLSAAGFAQGPGPGPGAGRGPMGGGGMRGGCPMGMSLGDTLKSMPDLGLTPDQQNRITTLDNRFNDQVSPLSDQMQQKHRELQSLWAAPNPDRDAIVAKQAEMDTLHDSMRSAYTDYRLAVLKILTPEQRAKVAAAPKGQQGGMGGPMGTCPGASFAY